MRSASLKRYQSILNIGLKKSEQQVRPIFRDIRYTNPEHTVIVDVLHKANNNVDQVLSFNGKDEVVRLPKAPEETWEVMEVHISRDYLKDIIDNIAPGTSLYLRVGTDKPLKIEGLLDDETEVRTWIAPRIENE